MTGAATVLEEIRTGLAGILESDPESLILGEDLLDPYGGAFKVTKGLSTRFPDQVLQTPISEAGFVGVATGLAVAGFRPIVEIMFGDFLTLAVDPVVNGAAKLPWLNPAGMPGSVLLRTPMGGRRGYGPIHSQSLEKLFLGWPGVAVFAAHRLMPAGELLRHAFDHPAKVKLFLETKSDYSAAPFTREELARRGFALELAEDSGGSPLAVVSNCDGAEPDVAICCYGGMVTPALDAAWELLVEREVASVVLVPARICPLDAAPWGPIADHVRRAGRLVCAEEGYAQAGWGSYLLGALAESGGCPLPLDVVRLVGPAPEPIPADPERERRHLPGAAEIVRAVEELL